MNAGQFDTSQKALQINLDPSKYGTFAEIGAGQETVRWFFKVGGAAGTVAKSMSAYDMTFSDAIYGQAPRYVCKERLNTMLDHEYELLIERLGPKRGTNTQFFVFANTVTTTSYRRSNDGHGWLGVAFQPRPGAEPSRIFLHTWAWQRNAEVQQYQFGVLGVNLIHAALYFWQEPERLIDRLYDNLSKAEVEVDSLEFRGPVFKNNDPVRVAFRLVAEEATNAVIIRPSGEVVTPGDYLYKKAVLVQRARCQPLTLAHTDIQRRALEAFRADLQRSQPAASPQQDIISLIELPLTTLECDEEGTILLDDFYQRVNIARASGTDLLFSNYGRYFRLSAFLRRYTREPIAFAMGIEQLRELLDPASHTTLEGGMLEALGRLLQAHVRIYIYPATTSSGETITANNFRTAPEVSHLYQHLLANRLIEPLENADPSCMRIHTNDVLALLEAGDSAWQSLVPEPIAALIREHHYFGWGKVKIPKPR